MKYIGIGLHKKIIVVYVMNDKRESSQAQEIPKKIKILCQL